MTSFSPWISRVGAVLLGSAAPLWAGWDIGPDRWVATDGLGRSLPTAAEVGMPKGNRTVGLFYFLWNEGQNPVYDLSKLRAANPEQPALGPPNAFHHWGEPLFGYYRQDDVYVLRKHLQMVSDAGVDVLFLDVTNALTYDGVRDRLCEVLSERRAQGQAAPSIAFLANSHSAKTVEHLYRTFYQPGKAREHWFLWQGKPLLLSPPEGLSEEVKAFFEIRHSWAWTKDQAWFGDGRDKWPWLDHTPQTPGWHESPDRPEQIVVCAAEHPISAIGRSFHGGHQPPPEQWQSGAGAYFAEQWQRALQVDPPFVFLTGWNEWIAQRFIDKEGTMSMVGRKLKPGDSFFVDQYSEEFSRDLEPMKGGFGDAYYYQMAGAIRRYKGARAPEPVGAAAIAVDGQFGDWEAAAPEFRDTLGDPARRDHPGWVGEPAFLDQSGRNDLAVAKVAQDAAHLYFYVRSSAALSAPGEHWMQLCLDTDGKASTGWLGYDFVVNRRGLDGKRGTLEKWQRDGSSQLVAAEIPLFWEGTQLELAIPRAALGLPQGAAAVDFKWVDNIVLGGEATAFTLHGDAAPNDRFNYRAMLPAVP